MERLVRSLGSDNDRIVADGLKVTFGEFAVTELNADMLTGTQLFKVVPFGILGTTKRGVLRELRLRVSRCDDDERGPLRFVASSKW